MVDQNKKLPIVYVYPPCRGCESMQPRCVMILRLLNFLDVKYKNFIAEMPDPSVAEQKEQGLFSLGYQALKFPIRKEFLDMSPFLIILIKTFKVITQSTK